MSPLKGLNVLLLLTCLLFLRANVDCDELKTLFVVTRHGMRAPFFLYENDPLNKTFDSIFPNGFGELTEKGKEQMLNVSAFLQANYSQFFAGKLCDEIEIKSCDQGRVIDSAKLLLKGLKSKEECDQIDSIYVDSVSSKMGDCLAFMEEYKKQQQTEYAQRAKKASLELAKTLPVSLSKDLARILKPERALAHIVDIVTSEYDATRKLPYWLSEELWHQMRQTYTRQFNLLSRSKKENRLFSGLFWGEIYTKATRLISTDTKTLNEDSFTKGDNYPTKKLNVYVGTDIFLINILRALQNYGPDDFKPVPGSTLIFELRELADGMSDSAWGEKHHIRILFFNETTDPINTNPYVLKVPPCVESEVCTVKKFFAFLSDMMLDHNQWHLECAETSRSAGSHAAINYGLALAAFLLPITCQLWQTLKFNPLAR